MSALTYEGEIGCRPSAVRDLLADRAFLEHWSRLHNPLGYDIEVDAHRTRLHWVLSTAGIPGFARGRVGDTIPVTLRFDWEEETAEGVDGRFEVDLEGKTTGTLRAAVRLRARGPRATVMAIHGEFHIHAGLFSGPAARLTKQHILVPILAHELYPELNAWCAGGRPGSR